MSSVRSLAVPLATGLLLTLFIGGCKPGSTEQQPPLTEKASERVGQQSPREEIVNSIGMRLVLIPAGKFWMGSPDTEKDRISEEVQHEVEITKAFFMGVFEVTQDEYQKVMNENPSWYALSGGGKRKLEKDEITDTRRFPVEHVSWQDAVEFCKKLSDLPEEKKAARVYRLPTEAEWEYACRGGASTKDTSAFHFGAVPSFRLANFKDDPLGPLGTKTTLDRPSPVGSYPPNPFGLHDMHGNLFEMCQNWYGKYNTKDQLDPQGPQTGTTRALRGGSFANDPSICRAARRGDIAPHRRYGVYGFRVVCVPAPGTPQPAPSTK